MPTGQNPGSNGNVTVDGAGSSLTSSGNTTVGDAGNGTLDITNGGVVNSANTTPTLINNGLVAPTGPNSTPGTLTTDGNYQQGPNGVLDTEVGGPQSSQADQLKITGTAGLTRTEVLAPNGVLIAYLRPPQATPNPWRSVITECEHITTVTNDPADQQPEDTAIP